MKLGNKIKLLAVICMVDLFLLGGLFRVVSDPQPAHVSTDDGTWVQEGGDTLDRAKGLEGKCIALTFDDGPHKDCTPQLLDGLKKRGVRAVCQAVDRTSRMIEDITGERPQYMRPPFGDWNEELECEVGMTTVLWSVDSLDWKLRNKNKIVKRVLKDVEDGDIILMHDIFPTSVDAALELVDTLTKRGYTFVTVDELLID